MQTPQTPRRRRRALARRSGRHAGFTYIGLLILVAAMGLALTVVAQLWHTVQLRDKEEELLFAGNEFRRAIGLYIASTGRYPNSLEDLLRDPGFPGVRRSLRKLYRDPITGSTQWGLVKPDANSIVGVYSRSDAQPLKQGGFSLADRSFEAKEKYSQWVFMAQAMAKPAAGATPSGAQDTSGKAAPDSSATLPGAGQSDTTRFGPRGRR